MLNNRSNKSWLEFSYLIQNGFITNDLIERSFNLFIKNKIINNIEDKHILVLLKIRLKNGELRTISYLQCVNKNELNSLLKILIEFWELKSEEYYTMEVSEILYIYKIISKMNNSKLSVHKKIKQFKREKEDTIEDKNIKILGNKLPLTMDLTKWGLTHFYDNYSKCIVFKKYSQVEYHIEIFNNYTICKYKLDKKILFTFKDFMLDSTDLTHFRREVNNKYIYIFEKGELKLKKKIINLNFIKSKNTSLFVNDKFLTMDLETRKIDNDLVPYCVSIYDGKDFMSFYLNDYENSYEMLKQSILSIMKRKYNGYRVYIHNFSNFDGIFLLDVLLDLSSDIVPLINDNKFINLKFKFAKYNLYFRDSYSMLPLSLRKLAQDFNVENKYIFPYLFVNNKNINLNYIGQIPPFEDFINIDLETYNKYCLNFNKADIEGKIWNLKNETIKYCNQDVFVLYNIIDKFSNIIFDLVRLDIHKFPTLPSLSIGIFRLEKFLGKSKIPIITGNIYKEIVKSYSGGNVDVYKPFGENLYHYDVNSLYPYIMRNLPVPVGNPIYFEGDITKYEDKPFGFFKVKIKSPNNLKIPLLQTKLKINNHFKTVTPLGKWNGYYFSEEIYKSIELGYDIHIIEGYTFEKENIFKDYVDFFYKIKSTNPKNTALYTIAKLLLNGLYGRFGMNPEQQKHIIVDQSRVLNLYNNYTVTDVLPFKNGIELISYFDNKEFEDNIENINMSYLNISIPIAAAVTAYARLHMYNFKNMYNVNCLYTDTDSVVLDDKLAEELVSPIELGKMKLEFISKKSIFLSSKVYFSITEQGNICKIKGFQLKRDDNLLSFNDFESLLFKNQNLFIEQEKWIKKLNEGKITIKKELYNLKVTSGKRELIYDENNKFVDTKPIIIDE